MSTRFMALQSRVGDQDDVRLVSFTLNPEFDTPQVLQEYAG